MIKTAGSAVKNFFKLKQPPSFITYFPTFRCNCRCIMCGVWKKKRGYELSLNEISDIFKQLSNVSVVRLSGGEPFLRDDFSSIVNLIDDNTSVEMLHITTNGVLTNKILSDIRKINNPGKIHIKVSIDSVGEQNDRIRGISGAYESSMKTVQELSKLSREKAFYLGVNQTIVNRESLSAYYSLERKLNKLDVPLHAVFAYEDNTPLYGEGEKKSSPEFKPFGEFKEEELRAFIKELMKKAKLFGNFKESLTKRYYLKGALNRLVNGKKKPNPPCCALKNHMRILPGGQVPVCLYNSTIVADLRSESLKSFWKGKKREKQRKWVKNCPGCWAGCETIVNGIYSGDIIKGI